jgi:hypothetical protein
MELGEKFLAQEVFEDSSLHQVNYLLEKVYEKQIEVLYKSSVSSAQLELKKQLNKPGSYYYYLYEIERKRYLLENYEGKRVEKGNIQNINLEKINTYLDVFYIAEKLKIYSSILSWKSLINIETNPLFIQEIIQLASTQDYISYPPIAIYYQILLTQTEFENEDHYYSLKELIKKHIHIFPKIEAKEISDSAINYTIQKYNKGNLLFLKENFEIYKESVENETLYTNSELSPWTFKNIVTAGLRNQEFTWTEYFINTYQSKINELYRENAINYNRAVLLFYKKEFSRAIPLLQKVQYDEVNYGMASKTMLIGIYYEIRDFDALYSYFDSLKAYLSRNKTLNSVKKMSYLDLIKFTKKLADSNHINFDLHKLKEQINVSSAFSKKWLLEKVDELIEA